MELNVLSIYDSKANVYNAPFFSPTLAEGERNFTKLSNDPQSDVSTFAEDYSLCHLGTYDTNTGEFRTNQTPVTIAQAKQLKKQYNCARLSTPCCK